jgi:predicted ATP-dependent endonuclease of OLD family
MEKIVIENFGPIDKAEVEIKDITIFIGTTSSGKSTVAKLISIFRDAEFKASTSFKQFSKLLSNYNIDFNFSDDTKIRYEYDEFYCEIRKGKIEDHSFLANSQRLLNPIYIPAERIFFPTISQSIFGLISNDIGLPKWFLDFGAEFEKARNTIRKFSIDFLKVDYEYNESQDIIKLPNAVTVRLSQASSGLQSVIPLILVIQNNTTKEDSKKDMFVIEEPELNLYPSSQKELTEFIIGATNASNDKLIITTHSPYLLTTLDNLIQADNVVKLKPEKKKEVARLIPEKYWIDFDKVACYFFDNGSCRSTLDVETRSIGPSNIDDVSETISETFEELLALKYAE